MVFRKNSSGVILLMLIFMVCVSMITPSHAELVESGVATASYMNIGVDIQDGYAVTSIEEKLDNNYDTAITDNVQFLIPEDAFMSGFSLIIDGVEYEADILEKQLAQERFESARESGSTAGLLETRGTELFSYSLNFKPQQSIIVKLTYEQALTRELNEYEYLQYLKSNRNVRKLNVAMNISSSTGIVSVDTPGYDIDISYPDVNSARVSYSSVGLPDTDMRVVFSTDNTDLNGEMLFYEVNGTGYFMHIFSPTDDDIGTEPLDKDIIFVIDRSGSMEGLKMEQMRAAFSDVIADLPEDDNFNVVFFDSDIDTLSKELLPANPSNKQSAVALVQSEEADKATNINSALVISLGMFTDGTNNVPIIVFLTDGRPTMGVESTARIRRNVLNANDVGASIFSIAFGEEDDYDFAFLQAMSLENRGTAIYFEADSEAAESIAGFYDTISTPLVSNLEYSYDGTYDVVHTGKDHLFAGSESIVLGKYETGTVSINSDVVGNTKSGTYTFSDTFIVQENTPYNFIPRLWAYNTIMDKLDTMKVEGSSATAVAEITNLSLEYGFVTPYTSFFVEIPRTEIPENESTDKLTESGEDLDWYARDDLSIDEETEDEEVIVDISSDPYDSEDSWPEAGFAGIRVEGDEETVEGEYELTSAPVEEDYVEEESPGFSAIVLVSTIGLFFTIRRIRRDN